MYMSIGLCHRTSWTIVVSLLCGTCATRFEPAVSVQPHLDLRSALMKRVRDRIYHCHVHTQEPLRAIPPVSSTTQAYHAYPSHTTYRVANLYFLALVIVQGERQRPFIDPPFCLVLVNPRMVTPSPKCSNVDSCLQQSALCTALPYSCCAGN